MRITSWKPRCYPAKGNSDYKIRFISLIRHQTQCPLFRIPILRFNTPSLRTRPSLMAKGSSQHAKEENGQRGRNLAGRLSTPQKRIACESKMYSSQDDRHSLRYIYRQVYKFMISGIIPRPIAYVSSVSEAGVENIAPFRYVFDYQQ